MKRKYDFFAGRVTSLVHGSLFKNHLAGRGRLRQKFFLIALSAVVSTWLLLGPTFGPHGPHILAATVTDPVQDQVIPVGILPFQDESGTDAPAEFGKKIAQELQQKLNAASKSLLARPLNTGTDPSSTGAMKVEQIAELGKQNSVKFVVRGGLLGASVESAGGETKLALQLYAEIISVETGTASTVRAEGAGTQSGASPTSVIQWNSVKLASGDFPNSALGQALSSSLEQLVAAIQPVIASPVAETTTEQSTQAETELSEAEATATESAVAEADEELQQLVAQAEALISSGAASTDSLTALNQSLEGLKASLAAKAGLLEQAQDTTQADQQIATGKAELQQAIAAIEQQVAVADSSLSDDTSSIAAEEQASGERKNVLATISEYLGETFNILQKIQEIRAAFRGADEESSYADPSATDEGYTSPTEEPVEDLSGVITEEGQPVEDVMVTDPESGVSDTTDSSGAYTLNGLIGGKLTSLIITKNGKQVGQMKVYMAPQLSAVADFELKPTYAKKGYAPAPRIIPSTVVIGKAKVKSGSTGMLKGVVRDAQGRFVPRALVSLKGLAVARTDSRGQYVFVNVPAGSHQLSVVKSGLRLKSQQVQVAAKQSSEFKTQFASGDRVATAGSKIIARGTGTVLRGLVLNAEKRPLAGAKVTAIQSASAVSVMSGPTGKFELRDLKPGAYKILISKLGYEGGAQTALLRAGGAEQRDFQLKKKSSPIVERALAKRRANTNPIGTKARAVNDKRVLATSNLAKVIAKGRLTGHIVDAQTRKPVQGARIFIGRQSTQTDQAGNYVVNNLPLGSQQASISKAGFLTQEKIVTIRADGKTREDFALKANARAERIETSRTLTSQIKANGTSTAAGTTNSPIKKVVSTGQLRGRVVDAKTGKPVAGATVALAGQRSVATDQSGGFAFANLAPGTYQVSVRRNGFTDGGGALVVRAGATATASFRLSPKLSPVIRMKLPGRG